MANTISGNPINSHNLLKSQNNINKSLSRLSSGYRINSAKDDAAGLSISDRLNSQIRGINQAMRNASDGISLLQTADGGLSESTNILQRMRELSIQSGNGSYNDQDRAAMNAEFSQLQSELDRVAGNTTFNGKSILDGSLASQGIDFQIGADTNETINVQLTGAAQSDLGTSSLDITTSANAQNSLAAIDQAIEKVSGIRGNLGAVQNRFESAISNLGNVSENLAGADSRIADADVAAEVSDLVKNRILQQSGLAMQAQANQSAQSVLSLLK